MPCRDQVTVLNCIPAISPVAAYTDNTAVTSAIINMQGYESVTFAVNIGVLSDSNATFAITLQDGTTSDLSDAATVGSDYIIGDTSFTFADDNTTVSVGYVGKNHYVRMIITPTGNTGNAYFDAIAIQGNPTSAQLS